MLSGIKFTVAILTACMMGGMTMAQERSDIAFDRTDLDFVLKQIVISERHAAGEELINILPNTNLPWGMRTVDGRYNNLQPGQEGFGQADLEFPESAMRDFRDASDLTFDPDGPGGQAVGEKTSYNSATNVEDSTPRLISHLIVNQSTDNPAAVHAAAEEEGENIGPDITGVDQFFIGNVATDEGLSAPSNTLLTFFGQFFDHGLDLINKGGNGNVFMRVPADDPLFDDTAGSMNMMIMPRASRDPGPDGVRGTADDVPKFINATTPHVDQQQTYASHSSSQILLRHYAVMGAGSGAADVENIGAWMDGDVPGYNHAAPAGSNRVLVVMAHAEDNGSTADMTDFTSVTYGGQALTQVVEQRQHQTTAGGFSAVAEIWILDEAGLQAAANSNIVATTTGGNGANEAKRISSLFFSGVDQADPTGQTGTDGENDNNTQTLSVTVTGGELDDGDMVIANNTVRNDQTGDVSFAWANGFVPTGEYSPSPNSVGAFLTYSDAQTLADGAETATVQIMNNGVGALSVVVLNHATGSAGATLQNTGLLLEGYGPDETLDTADDGGMATWDTAQAQGRLKLGLDLDDMDGNNVPMIYSDEYGNFIPGSDRGLPQLVTSLDPLTLVEGNLAANGGDGVDATMALRVNHSFFLDVAHSANPNGKIPDTDSALNPRTDMLSGQVTRGIRADGIPDMGQATYDDELLGRHFICGDGRCNENIALSTVHTIFHAEHNRLSAQTQRVVLDSGDLDFLNEWLDTDVPAFPAWGGLPFDVSNASLANQAATIAAIDALNLDWNGSRLFQSARFGTEMQYNRVVFDEFVPTLAGLKDPFDGFHIDVDPSITFEFSQSVYRFGHSMLTETVERRDPDYNPITETHTGNADQLGLFEAFLNPLALYNAGDDGVATITPEQGTGAVIRGLTRAGGNEIDEFVTGGMQNNVVGLPLDLGAINIARGRDVGNPRLNDARRTFFDASGDPRVVPYADWLDYADNLRHELTLINLIAAYGTHTAVAGDDGQIGTYDANEPDTYASRRAAACGIVSSLVPDLAARATYCTGHEFAMVQPAVPADALDFLLSRGTWATGADGRATTGLEDIDFWVGGLAEERMPFGGLLGSTHNFVFEVQAEALQNGDRFYYVGRTKGTGLNFFSELESNSFTALIMRNTDLGEVGGSTLPINIFA
ncbi:MAG: peroxidase family protein, partial [Myxococcota bacterium]|nr:peroxidase family protein [Myxococcota bacterium]